MDTPIKWLWAELHRRLDGETLQELHEGFTKQSEIYNRASKIRQCEYEIRLYTKNQKIYPVGSKQHINYAEKLKRRIARLARLKDEHSQNQT